MKNIKAILIGCGMVGTGFAMDTYQRGVDYVAAFDVDPDLIGKDLGDVAGGEVMGCLIQHAADLEQVLKENEIDIAIVTTTAPVEVCHDQIVICLENKVNILTSLADSYCMERTMPEIGRELDRIAKENGVTFYSSGIQDVFWTALPVALTGCCLEIQEIKGTNIALIDEFGPSVADECYVGWNLEDFQKANESGLLSLNDFCIALYELAKKLGLHPISEHSDIQPIVASQDMYFETIDRHVKEGQLLGNEVVSVVRTEENIKLICYFVSKMSEEGDTDLNKWEITGNPNINVITERMQGEITTGSNMINRIPDVIKAAPGVISASQMEMPFFKYKNLNEYFV